LRGDSPISLDLSALISELRGTSKRMLNDLEAFYFASPNHAASLSIIGDAKRLPLRASGATHIICSPPYLTRIDYAIATMPELLLTGTKEALNAIRHRTMGAPVITSEEKAQTSIWGVLCNDLLDRIKAHHTKAAASYYWKNIVQYFMDLEAALRETKRVLRNGGTGLFVVQSSYFKEIELPLGRMYVEMAQELGFESEIVFSEVVKNHMAHVNTRSNKYKSSKVYSEDFVFVRNRN
jgi:hypothetical protein